MTLPTTRQRLIRTAQELFHRQGYAATGVAQILRESASGSGSLYHFFKTKEYLLQAVLDHLEERLEREIIGPAFASSPDPVERIFGLLGFYRGFLEATGCRLGCPVGNLTAELADSHDDLRKRLDALLAVWRGAVQTCLEEAAPRLPADTDLSGLATLVLTVMEGGVLQARAQRSLELFDKSVGELRKYFDLLLQKQETAT